jgi:hypothetical protein
MILAGIALVALAGNLSAQNSGTAMPGTNTLLQREVGRALARLGATDAFAMRMRQAGTPEAALQMGDSLAHRGVGRLDTPTLQVRAEILNKLFASADVATCAQWSRGILDPAKALVLLNSLDSVTTSRWGDVSARAMVAEMNATAPMPALTSADVLGAFATARNVMDSADQARIRDVMSRTNPESITDADMCSFSRALYASVPRLSAGPRATVLNVFARMESQ